MLRSRLAIESLAAWWLHGDAVVTKLSNVDVCCASSDSRCRLAKKGEISTAKHRQCGSKLLRLCETAEQRWEGSQEGCEEAERWEWHECDVCFVWLRCWARTLVALGRPGAVQAVCLWVCWCSFCKLLWPKNTKPSKLRTTKFQSWSLRNWHGQWWQTQLAGSRCWAENTSNLWGSRYRGHVLENPETQQFCHPSSAGLNLLPWADVVRPSTSTRCLASKLLRRWEAESMSWRRQWSKLFPKPLQLVHLLFLKGSGWFGKSFGECFENKFGTRSNFMKFCRRCESKAVCRWTMIGLGGWFGCLMALNRRAAQREGG